MAKLILVLIAVVIVVGMALPAFQTVRESNCGQRNPSGVSESTPEIVIDLPKTRYEPPVPEKTIVFSIVTAADQKLGFAVYSGRKLESDLRLIAADKSEMIDLIVSHIAELRASAPNLDTVLIECDGNLPVGDVETIKAGVQQAGEDSSLKLYFGIRDNVEAPETTKVRQ